MPSAPAPAWPTSRAAPEPLRRWELGRNGSLRPLQLLAGCALPCALGLVAGLGFAAYGSPWPLVFALLQTLAMALAFALHARHGADRAVLTLRHGWLEVAKRRGSRLSVVNLPLACLRMQVDARGLRLECGSSRVRIQGYATAAACAAVLSELEQARSAATSVASRDQGRAPAGPQRRPVSPAL
ncbi:DUF2244 domain-containing protein [Pelomonas sp. BJYL3]|uniref:DUF2244 domain-containing protein n=1 Tax=Pelomonas sp. BJYL3 TaxID=2976697 RepID=UPI0022B302F0|nr:DUF2244 domain-containing protein [Pelomonas sp. BJYL3]